MGHKYNNTMISWKNLMFVIARLACIYHGFYIFLNSFYSLLAKLLKQMFQGYYLVM